MVRSSSATAAHFQAKRAQLETFLRLSRRCQGQNLALPAFKVARYAIFQERCPPRQKSRVERLKAKVKPLLTQVTVENADTPPRWRAGRQHSGLQRAARQWGSRWGENTQFSLVDRTHSSAHNARLSHRTFFSISFRKITPPQNYQQATFGLATGGPTMGKTLGRKYGAAARGKPMYCREHRCAILF